MRGWRWDAAVAVAVVALNVVTAMSTADPADRPLVPLGWVLLIGASAPLPWRRRFPVTALVITGAVTLAYYPLGFPDAPVVLNLVLALYTVARDREPALTAGAAGALAVALSVTAEDPLDVAAGVVPILLLPVALGAAARVRVRRTAHAEERARVAEAALEAEALRERLRIARELHDVLAHQISLINVQAGAALHTGGPDSAFEALRAIRTASGEALHEIRSVLGVLRDASPAPDLTALPGLFDSTGTAGLTVRARVELPEPAPPQAVQLAAYRIVQESLTNAVRHSSATAADVTVRRAGADLEIIVEDDGTVVAETTDGNGVRGMTERAAAVGGELRAGPRPGGGFRVRARLPIGPR
jgi:signal transduction histidine kinase